MYSVSVQDPIWTTNPDTIYSAYRNTSAWQPTTVTWDSKPGTEPTAVSSTGASHWQDDGTPWHWDVTSVVNDWISGRDANFGLTIQRNDTVWPDAVFVTKAVFVPFGPVGEVPTLVLETSVVSAAPEPTSLLLAGIGAMAIAGCWFWRKA